MVVRKFTSKIVVGKVSQHFACDKEDLSKAPL